eukprot:5449539-Prymnesium_polylepis.1
MARWSGRKWKLFNEENSTSYLRADGSVTFEDRQCLLFRFPLLRTYMAYLSFRRALAAPSSRGVHASASYAYAYAGWLPCFRQIVISRKPSLRSAMREGRKPP